VESGLRSDDKVRLIATGTFSSVSSAFVFREDEVYIESIARAREPLEFVHEFPQRVPPYVVAPPAQSYDMDLLGRVLEGLKKL